MSDQFARLLERLQSAQLKARTSSAMKPLLWIVGTCLSAATLGAIFGAPVWFLIAITSLSGVSIAVALGVGVRFAIRDPDALRSESYVIHKMAIERGFVGSDVTGLIESPDTPPQRAELSPGVGAE